MVKTKVWLGVWSLSAMCPLGFICAYQGSTEPAKPPELQSAIEPNPKQTLCGTAPHSCIEDAKQDCKVASPAQNLNPGF